jgi:hypothetical protein
MVAGDDDDKKRVAITPPTPTSELFDIDFYEDDPKLTTLLRWMRGWGYTNDHDIRIQDTPIGRGAIATKGFEEGTVMLVHKKLFLTDDRFEAFLSLRSFLFSSIPLHFCTSSPLSPLPPLAPFSSSSSLLHFLLPLLTSLPSFSSLKVFRLVQKVKLVER